MKCTYYAALENRTRNVVMIEPVNIHFKHTKCVKLYPNNFLKKQFAEGKISKQEYRDRYRKSRLDKLDAKEIYEELGENAILCIWSGFDKYTHREIVVEWLEEELGITIERMYHNFVKMNNPLYGKFHLDFG